MTIIDYVWNRNHKKCVAEAHQQEKPRKTRRARGELPTLETAHKTLPPQHTYTEPEKGWPQIKKNPSSQRNY